MLKFQNQNTPILTIPFDNYLSINSINLYIYINVFHGLNLIPQL